MRTSMIAAVLLTGLGAASLSTPAAAVPASPSAVLGGSPDTIVSVRMKRHRMKRRGMRMGAPGTSGGPSTAKRGAPAGSIGGNGVSGSDAAPTGR